MSEKYYQRHTNDEKAIQDQLDSNFSKDENVTERGSKDFIFPGMGENENNPLSWWYKLTKYEIEHLDQLEDEGITPEQAKAQLEKLGYKEEDWQEISGFSHGIFALVLIANGDKKRLYKQVVKNHMSEIGYVNHEREFGKISQDDLPPPGGQYTIK